MALDALRCNHLAPLGFKGLTVGLSLRLLCPDLPDPSSSTERTSDNQRLRTSNDINVRCKAPHTENSAGMRY